MATPSLLSSAPPHIIVGTAGHVDHGKSSLVQALTGTDPDRLPQEKARGMTIELGFAFLRGGAQGVDVAFVDCPGHERFIHHMVAGAGGIDGALLVVAADEGPRPQTLEHLAVLRLLGVAWGRVVLSKADLVDETALASVTRQVEDLVAGTPFAVERPVAVSARSGRGLAELVSWLFDRARMQPRPPDGAYARLAIDRVFSIAGAGTVVTGTLRSGGLSVGDRVEIFPGGEARVRGLHVSGFTVRQARAGHRTAVNLADLDREAIQRGAWLATPGSLRPTRHAEVRIQFLEQVAARRMQVEIHHGVARTFAGILLSELAADEREVPLARLRLETPLYLRRDDRFLIRRPSPSATLGGGTVLETDPPRRRQAVRMAVCPLPDPAAPEIVTRYLARSRERWEQPDDIIALQSWAGGPGPAQSLLDLAGDALIQRQCAHGTFVWAASSWRHAWVHVLDLLAQQLTETPERCWWQAEELHHLALAACPSDAWNDLVAQLIHAGDLVSWQGRLTAPGRIPPIPEAWTPLATRLLDTYRAAGLAVPYNDPAIAALDAPRLGPRVFAALIERGRLLRIDQRFSCHRIHAEALVAAALDDLPLRGRLDVGWMRDRYGLTRKHIAPYLDWLDAIGITRRDGDVHLRARATGLAVPLLGQA